jgi:BlaI family penicillinase repressor
LTASYYARSIKSVSRKERPPALTPLQLAVMQVLWACDEASVADVQKGMTGKRLALTTVATLLTRLEQRDLVTHRVDGRQYLYRARVSPVAVRQSVTRDLLGSLFHGDVTAFVTQLLDARDLTREELADLKRLIRTKERA